MMMHPPGQTMKCQHSGGTDLMESLEVPLRRQVLPKHRRVSEVLEALDHDVPEIRSRFFKFIIVKNGGVFKKIGSGM